MAKNVLIIGGAGFIGSHTADELFRKGYNIRILDNLSPITHYGQWPDYLNSAYEKIEGDVRNRKILKTALTGIDYVIHLAAKMDLMPSFSSFFDINVTSTALLYELIVKYNFPVKKVLIASSQFVYGEGHWYCPQDNNVFPKQRTVEQLLQKQWDPLCPICGGSIKFLTNLERDQDPPNQYAISKYSQELIALKIGKLYNIPSVTMRYSIVHGPRQTLKNAYSGALRIFTLQALQNKDMTIFEDGLSKRDYVSVYDVARANVLVLENNQSNYENYNVAGRKAFTVLELANIINSIFNNKIKINLCNEFRVGDIRHAVSDTTKLKKLGWKILNDERETILEYIEWVRSQKIDKKYLITAEKQMRRVGVIKKII